MNKITCTAELIQMFPACTVDILECMKCSQSEISTNILVNVQSQYAWCRLLVCNNCSFHWYLCASCQISKRMSISNLRYHHTRFHDGKLQIYQSLPSFELGGGSDFMQNNSSYSEDHVGSTYRNDRLMNNINHCNNFQQFCQWYQKNLSLEYLMGLSFFDQKESYENIEKYDAELNLKIFEFIISLSRPQQQKFVAIINGMKPYMLQSFNMMHPSSDSNHSINLTKKRLVLPHTYNDLRRIHLRGKTSMMESIPQVPVKTIGSGKNMHSYVSLKECINHFLLFGGSGVSSAHINDYDSISSIIHSKRCVELMKNSSLSIQDISNAIFLPFVMFSDDFDPSASLVKANRRGIWIYSCTFKNIAKDLKEVSSTYILSIGNKGADHQPVLSLIEREINEVRSGGMEMSYHGTLCRYILPIAFPLLRHGDQPERRSINMLKLGKETNHARWRHSLDIQVMSKYLPSCHQCSSQISNHLKTNSNNFDGDKLILGKDCIICSNWSFNPKYSFLHSNPPPEFPKDEVPENGKLPPVVLNSNVLKMVFDKTHQKVSAGVWTIQNDKAYLSYYCIKTSVSLEILDHATNCYNLRVAKEANSMDETFGFIIEDAQKYPSKYNPVVPSHIINLSTDDLDCFPDTPMHLISGYIKAVLSLLILFLKRKSCYNHFFQKISQNKIIDYIHSMKLSWLKVLPFSSEKFAGYACENYLSLCYILKYICFVLGDLKQEDNFAFPHNSTQPKWTAKINRKWLSIRGLDSKGDAKCLKDRVSKYMEKNENIEIEKIHLLKMKEIIRMMISCYNSVHLLLSPTTSEILINRTHLSVIRALNDIHQIDKYLRANQKNPIWYVKYNLLCLLNCAEDMRYFGPCKDRWEGSMEGEKAIQYLKKNSTDTQKNFNYIYTKNTI